MSVAANAMLYQEPGKVPSIALALLVHLLLLVFLFFGVRWQSRQPEAVMVELWNIPPAPVVEQVVAQPPPKPEVKPEPKPVEKAVEPPKPDIALEKKKEVKKEMPKKPEPKLNLDRSKDIREQLERETAALSQQLDKDRILDQMRRETATAAATADAAYIGKLKGKIKSNIVLPPDIPGNPEAIFDVVQLPTGEIMSVKLRKSSGHTAYDAAVERAILKSSPPPKPDRPEQFQRSLEIKFRPLELK
ncbi:MAG: TonB C-terminal domain-containing protein [Betaproteobacteria bacterium]|nr:TonB C-terminal domain-containing protein [Betaproteobacteria bacterium]